MKNKSKLFAVWIIIFSMLLAGCGGNSTGAPEPGPTSLPEETTDMDNPGDIEEEKLIIPDFVGMDYEQVKIIFPELVFDIKYEHSDVFIKNQIMQQSIPADSEIIISQPIYIIVSAGATLIELEDYEGGTLHIEDVSGLISRQGFPLPKIEYEENDEIPMGYVIRTDPPAGAMVEANAQITVFVSIGVESDVTFVPDMLGLTKQTAESRAQMHDIVLIFVEEHSSTVETGRVIRQQLPPMTEVEKMSEVEVYISKGPRTTKDGVIRHRITGGLTGEYIVEHLIDGILQPELTVTQDIAQNKVILWEFEGTGVKRYAIWLTSVETGKNALFCEYEFDFRRGTVKSTVLQMNDRIFTELSTVDDDGEPDNGTEED